MIARRAGLLGAASALAGCGFHPLYAGGSQGAASTELAAIYVGIMGERSGQLLRQALQRRFEGAGTGVAKTYELTGGLGVAAEAIALQRDSSGTRVRLIGSAPWVLSTMGLTPTPLTQGTARSIDGYNVFNQQYFAADLESDAAQRRIAESIADQITIQVASFLKRRAAAKPA